MSGRTYLSRHRKRGGALPLVLGAAVFFLGILAVLHIIRSDRLGRIRLKVSERRADFLARSALAHTLHKVKRCLVHIDELLDGTSDGLVDMSTVEPAFISDIRVPVVPFDRGTSVGFYKVHALKIRRQKARGGHPAYTLSVKVEGRVETRPAKPPKVYSKIIERELYLEGTGGI